jgi:hypothetical protein
MSLLEVHAVSKAFGGMRDTETLIEGQAPSIGE